MVSTSLVTDEPARKEKRKEKHKCLGAPEKEPKEAMEVL